MYKLTLIQKDLLDGKEYAPNSFFKPVQDINNDWFISEEEITNCTIAGFEWLKELKASEFVAKPNDLMTNFE